MTLFVMVARLVVAREESAVALVEARTAADAATLESLRRRLEPHFLFNALNALRATIRVDPDRARDLVSDLADLYRYLLSHPNDATVRDEVSHASSYLEIERARFGDERLRVVVDVDDAVAHERVPALLLQPLVENAVKHGVATRTGEGVITISARREADALVLCVADETSGEHVAASEAGAGIALATLKKRLTNEYGDAATLSLETRAEGARAEVRLPLGGPPKQTSKRASALEKDGT